MPCRLQYLEDADPFGCGSFPEPRRAPVYAVAEALALGAQLPALHRLLGAPLPVRGSRGAGGEGTGLAPEWGGGDCRLEGAGEARDGAVCPRRSPGNAPGVSHGGIPEPLWEMPVLARPRMSRRGGRGCACSEQAGTRAGGSKTRAGGHPRVVGAEPSSTLLPQHTLSTPVTGSGAEPRWEHAGPPTQGTRPVSLLAAARGPWGGGGGGARRPPAPRPSALVAALPPESGVEIRAEQFPPARRKAGG